MQEIVRQIRELVLSRWTNSQLHGIDHWDRVYDYGKQLVAPGVDPLVVALFAYLHDSCRTGDGYDTSHGPRAAEWIDSLSETYLKPLSDEQIRLLKEACRLHTPLRRRETRPSMHVLTRTAWISGVPTSYLTRKGWLLLKAGKWPWRRTSVS